MDIDRSHLRRVTTKNKLRSIILDTEDEQADKHPS
jgi:hypothetical protein